eukprot:TRINITY_DN8186_c0_g1_i1.p1 TRINITY_DN8186_c0_g1~~TRINITY_DN8186_c0_g1_i1.p1  ORF type:complete len:603 (+),score=145.80 TRINITY_DN8186_c0_g1_i1:114-1922(+)
MCEPPDRTGAATSAGTELRKALEGHRDELAELYRDWNRQLDRLQREQMTRQAQLVERLLDSKAGGAASAVAADAASGAADASALRPAGAGDEEKTAGAASAAGAADMKVNLPGSMCDESKRGSDTNGNQTNQVTLSAWVESPSKTANEVTETDDADKDESTPPPSPIRKQLTTGSRRTSGMTINSQGSIIGFEKGTLRYYIHHAYFRTLVSSCILLNAFFMGVHSHVQLTTLIATGHELGFGWDVIEQAFCVFFFLELVLRMFAEKWNFLRLSSEEAPWNAFDTILVIFSVFDVMSSWLGGGSTLNFNFARTLRILRFARILRIIRVMRFFHSFRLMVYSILYSMVSLMWVFMLLLFIMYSFAALFLHGVTDHFRSLTTFPIPEEDELSQDLTRLFGSVPIALRSLFMGISGGLDWIELMEPLAALSWVYGIIFVMYVFFMIFGVLNVVIGIFVDASNDISQKNREIVTKNEMDKNKNYAEHLRRFFHEADADNTGTLSWEEFEAYLQDTHVQAYFQSFELDVSQAKSLFKLLDMDESNDVEIDEFVQGCMRLKGQARSIDVNMLLYESEKILNKQNGFLEYMAKRFDEVRDMRIEDLKKLA